MKLLELYSDHSIVSDTAKGNGVFAASLDLYK
jgi:hypothetical protein